MTELVLQEGDLVTVMGYIQERLVPEGAYRAEHGARMLVMAYPVLTCVFLARLEELRWLVALHRWIFLALIVGGVIGLGNGRSRRISSRAKVNVHLAVPTMFHD